MDPRHMEVEFMGRSFMIDLIDGWCEGSHQLRASINSSHYEQYEYDGPCSDEMDSLFADAVQDIAYTVLTEPELGG